MPTARPYRRPPDPTSLSDSTDPYAMITGVKNVVDGLSRTMNEALERGDPWEAAFLNPTIRLAAWEQIGFAQLILDKLQWVLLDQLDPAGWVLPEQAPVGPSPAMVSHDL